MRRRNATWKACLKLTKKASEEITYFLDHLKKTWFYFALLLYRLLRILGNCSLTVFYIAFSGAIFVFINLLRVIVLGLISVYFLLKLILPFKFKQNPLANKKRYQKLLLIDEIGKNSRVLCLDLDETLVYCSQSKPANGPYVKFTLVLLDQPVRTYYLQKRPFLDEFLDEVS